MKQILLVCLLPLLLISSSIKGQSTYVDEFNLKISSIEFLNKYISGDIESGDIVINGTTDNSIKIVAEVYNAPGKNYTCKPNECMIVDQNLFHFSIKPREGERIKKIEVTAPSYLSFKLKIFGKGSVAINNIHGEIQVITMRQGNITLKDTKGPISVSGTYGDINIDFINGISKKPMAVSLVKGNININIAKNEPITIVSSCFDEKSTLKDQPVVHSNGFKSINGVVISGIDIGKDGKRKMTINASYKERVENRKFLRKGASNATQASSKKAYQAKEDVYVYDINGGGTNLELNLYEGNIIVNE